MPPHHPARGMFDTFYLKAGEPESVLLRTHTSPVQVRLMESRPPPIYAVVPGRCYRRDTPDARHLPVFHQVEALVVDEGISMGDLAGVLESFYGRLFRARAPCPAPAQFLPFYRAVGRVRRHVLGMRGYRLPHLLGIGLGRARRLRDGRPGRFRTPWA